MRLLAYKKSWLSGLILLALSYLLLFSLSSPVEIKEVDKWIKAAQKGTYIQVTTDVDSIAASRQQLSGSKPKRGLPTKPELWGIQTFGPLAPQSKSSIMTELVQMLDDGQARFASDLQAARTVPEQSQAKLDYRHWLAVHRAELQALEDDTYWTILPSAQRLIFSKLQPQFRKMTFYLYGTGYAARNGTIVSVVFPINTEMDPFKVITYEQEKLDNSILKGKLDTFNRLPLASRRAKAERYLSLMHEMHRLTATKLDNKQQARLRSIYGDDIFKEIPRNAQVDKEHWQLYLQDTQHGRRR